MSEIKMNRRNFLQSTAVTIGAAIISPVMSASTTKTDSTLVAALSDGYFDMPNKFFTGSTAEQRAELGNPVRIGANAYVHRDGDRLFLFGSGAGNGDFITSQFTTVGKIPNALVSVGLTREDITDVVITHMHPDHIGGVVYDGAITYPNAKIHMDAAEWDFWNKKGFADNGPEQMRPMIAAVQDITSKIESNVIIHKGEADLGAGVVLQPAYGHTPGHSTIMLSVGNESLLVLGDSVVSERIHFSHPDVGWVLDFDPAAATNTRKRLLDQAATDKLMVAGNHLTAPGLGYVERDGNGYRFRPI